MDKRVFDDAIGEVPPPMIDVEAVIARGRRADRIRRVANPAVAAGVAVVLAVGAIAFTMSRGDDESGGIGVASPPTSTGTKAPPTTNSTTGPPTAPGTETLEPPEACSRTDLESGAQVVARLTPLLKAAVQAQRPDLQLTTNPGNEYPDGVSHGPLDFFYVTGETPTDEPFCGTNSYFLTRATTEGPEGKGNILSAVQVSLRDKLDECDPSNSGEQTDCESVTGPGGDLILKQTRELEGGTTMTRVDVLRPDGTLVTVQSENIDTSVKSGDAPTSSVPPLSYDQLVAIATDPGMTLFP